jgi:hypothetical protein
VHPLIMATNFSLPGIPYFRRYRVITKSTKGPSTD